MRTVRLVLLLMLLPAWAWAQTGDALDRFINARGLAGPASVQAVAATAPLSQASPQTSTPPQAAATPADRMSELVVAAMGALGVPYRRGGNSYGAGFDCSGFVLAVYQQTLGLILPRQAAQQAAATQTIARSELQPGDLVFFNTLRRAFSHVGIYVGDNKFIHSPKPGAAVRIEDMRVNYWNRRFDGARRVAGDLPSHDAEPADATEQPDPDH